MISIYTDGSYDSKSKKAGWGFVAVNEDNIKLYEAYGMTIYEAWSRQIDGEVEAAVQAIKWASENNYEKIRLFHDYLGISKWLLGEWKVKSKIAKKYIWEASYYNVIIEFHHIKGHTGDKWNEYADQLADKAKRRIII